MTRSKEDPLAALRGPTHYVLADGTRAEPDLILDSEIPQWVPADNPTEPYLQCYLEKVASSEEGWYFSAYEIAFEVYDDDE